MDRSDLPPIRRYRISLFPIAHSHHMSSYPVIAVIETYTKNTRFCLICNYVDKINEAIQSRCTRFRFRPLGNEQVAERLEQVVTSEG